MFSITNFLFLSSLALISWGILCYVKYIEEQRQAAEINFENTMEPSCGEPTHARCDTEFGLSHYLAFFCCFGCIYVLSKLSHLLEKYLAYRLEGERPANTNIDPNNESVNIAECQCEQDRLQKQLAALKQKNDELQQKIDEMSKNPSGVPPTNKADNRRKFADLRPMPKFEDQTMFADKLKEKFSHTKPGRPRLEMMPADAKKKYGQFQWYRHSESEWVSTNCLNESSQRAQNIYVAKDRVHFDHHEYFDDSKASDSEKNSTSNKKVNEHPDGARKQHVKVKLNGSGDTPSIVQMLTPEMMPTEELKGMKGKY